MEPIRFSKLSGSGNDFILIDNREGIADGYDLSLFAQVVCKRALSVGADGVIFIENDPKGECDFAWQFYNSDGSKAEMCGNGGRCAGRFAYKNGIAGKIMSFRSLAGVVHGEITGERSVRLQLTPPSSYEPQIKLDGEMGPVNLAFLDTGVPHAVIEVEDANKVDVPTLGAFVRNHERFAPQGANANFVSVSGENELLIRTFERGVEGETLACGTGATAVAVAMTLAGRVAPPVKLITRSGESLTVSFENTGKLPEAVYFEGNVTWVYDGVFLPEALVEVAKK